MKAYEFDTISAEFGTRTCYQISRNTRNILAPFDIPPFTGSLQTTSESFKKAGQIGPPRVVADACARPKWLCRAKGGHVVFLEQVSTRVSLLGPGENTGVLAVLACWAG